MSNRDFVRQWVSAVMEPPRSPVQIECLQHGWGRLQEGQSANGTPLCLHGKTFDGGFGVHADAEVRVTTDAPARRLTAWVGVDDNENTRGVDTLGLPPVTLTFSVEAEGRVLWQSPPQTLTDPPLPVDVALDDTLQFTLKVTASDERQGHAFGDWADARVERTDGSTATVGQPLRVRRLPRAPLFSFVLGGRPSAELLPQWARDVATEAVPGGARHRLTYRDPDTGLIALLELTEWEDVPAVEWVVRFRNEGAADTPLLTDVQALNVSWAATGEVWLHRSRGSHSSLEDFALQRDRLEPGTALALDCQGGRSSTRWLPFFQVQTGDEGVAVAVGWSGQWAADVTRDDAQGIALRAGMERTHLTLRPGEEVRTPRAALVFWKGAPIDGNNGLRRFLVAHHTPRPGGALVQAPLSLGVWGGQKTEVHLANIRRIKEEGLPYDVYWIDAGWYGAPEGYSPIEFTGKWWGQAGSWYPNPISHPEGMEPIADAAEGAGVRFLLWFEPERAVWGSQLTQEHPDWFLGERAAGKDMLLDLGNPAAREWLTEFLSGRITAWKIGVLRQDFNIEPLPYWRAADAPDRQGMTEIRHVTGLYAMWDELLRRHPGLVIDNCASGGRRLDLETVGRSIPLWRSDFQCFPGAAPLAAQCHTFGLSHWLPLSGTAVHMQDPGSTYDFRSALTAALSFQSALPEWRDKMMADYRRVRPLWYGDFYPLTPYSSHRDVWCAFQLHRTDRGEGCVLAFRREESPFSRADFGLHGLVPDTEYLLEDADTGQMWTASGKSLAGAGLRLAMENVRQSRLVFYRVQCAII